MTTYEVTYERDARGWWVATIPSVPGCHTQGRTLSGTRRRLREALGLWVDDAESAALVDDIRLPALVRISLERTHAARARVERDRHLARSVTREAARLLTADFGLSVRDAAELLGLSHQRIHQLTTAEEPAPSEAR